MSSSSQKENPFQLERRGASSETGTERRRDSGGREGELEGGVWQLRPFVWEALISSGRQRGGGLLGGGRAEGLEPLLRR